MSSRGSENPGDTPIVGRARTVLLLATVFASGAAVMIVEMTAVRAIQPFFGSTNFVWTNVIAVVLAALAIGYALGGRLADARPSPALLYGLMSAGGGLLLVTAVIVTPVSRLFLGQGVELEGIVSSLIRGSLGATLILFAPPILLLGMISPLAIRLLSRGGVGRAAGRVFAISTVGSILGTYLPTLLLIPALGSRGSILLAGGVLIAAGLAGFIGFGRRRGAIFPTVLAVIALTVASTGNLKPDRGAPPLGPFGQATVLAEVESAYQFLTVRDDVWDNGTRERVLTINESVYSHHALRRMDRVLTGVRHYDDYVILPLLLDLPPGSELAGFVVGMACGVNAAQWHHFWKDVYRLRVEGAEIDPAVMDLGREFFDFAGSDPDWLEVHAMDGRQVLQALPADRRYHLMVVDAFTNDLYVPFHLATREFFELCRHRLFPGGILAMNVHAVGAGAPNLRAIENTLATVFGSVVRVKRYDGENFLLLARNGDSPPLVERLASSRITERFLDWPDYTVWSGIAEWEDLLALGDAFQGEFTVVEPDAGEWVLTDDRAPLEWLTDRFLARLEDESLEEDPLWREEIHELAWHQGILLGFTGLGWVFSLALGLAVVRRLTRTLPDGPLL